MLFLQRLILFSLIFICCYGGSDDVSVETETDGSSVSSDEIMTNKTTTFMYFGYGSNLLAKRIHIQNPTAVRKTAGKLENYRLDFSNFSSRWNGAPATVIRDNNSSVWGAIWEIDARFMADLDRLVVMMIITPPSHF